MIVEFNPSGGDFQLEGALFLLEVRKVLPNHVILDPKVDDLPLCPMRPSNQLRFFFLVYINLKVSLRTCAELLRTRQVRPLLLLKTTVDPVGTIF